MSYEEHELWDVIGIKTYTLEDYYPFTCRTMHWSNNRIRTAYYAGVGQLFKGRAWNSSEVSKDFNKDTNWKGEQNITEIESLNLKRVSYYKNGFYFTHSDKLHGLYSMFLIFST